MATYSWSTITAQEALGFTDGDRLIFDTAGASALNVAIGWGSAVTTLALAGKSATFLTDQLQGNDNAQFVFLDGTNLLIDGNDSGAITFGIGGGQAMGLSPASTDNDVIDGTAAEGSIYANGNLGVDDIDGGEGNDTLFGGQGNDDVAGGEGDDSLNGNRDVDVVNGGEGNDTIYGGQGDDTELDGEAGDDWVSGDLGDDTASGGDGVDTLFGADGDDNLSGDAGEDSLSGNAGEDTLDGGDDADAIFGGRDDDVLVGGDGDDVISGDLDDDVITGGLGTDELTGGEDDDTFVFAAGDTPSEDDEFDDDDIDVITDFSDDDLIEITGGGAFTLDTDEADDFSAAVDAAEDIFAAGDDIAAIQVEDDGGVYVFVNIGAGLTADVDEGDVVIFLSGASVDDLSDTTFI